MLIFHFLIIPLRKIEQFSFLKGIIARNKLINSIFNLIAIYYLNKILGFRRVNEPAFRSPDGVRVVF